MRVPGTFLVAALLLLLGAAAAPAEGGANPEGRDIMSGVSGGSEMTSNETDLPGDGSSGNPDETPAPEECPGHTAKFGASQAETPEFVPGEVLVGFTLGRKREVEDRLRIEGGEPVNTVEEICLLRVKVPEGRELAFVEKFSGLPWVRYAELNVVGHLQMTPNDNYWGNQWGPTNIQANDAWDYQVGTHDIRLAILDNGIECWHEDLAGHWVDGMDFLTDPPSGQDARRTTDTGPGLQESPSR
jgi:hypothetical protein